MKERSAGTTLPLAQTEFNRVPASTYRLQLNQEFTFRNAARIVEYLNDLGITDCYASPIFSARPGSTHGYDVCNSAELNPQLGTAEQFDDWSQRLQTLGMGLLLDIVPNHMGADPRNPWWRDVLQHGKESAFANWFDIDWQAPRLAGKILLPILEDRYWKVLQAGKLQVVHRPDGFALGYHEHTLPLSRCSLRFLRQDLLSFCETEANALQSEQDLNAFKNEVLQLTLCETKRETRCSQAIEQGLAEQDNRPEISATLRRALERFNGTAGDAESFNALDALLRQQHYQLAYWRIGNEEMNYRRFFDISELVALRMELPEVFQATHRLTFDLLRQHKVTGLRIDHPDGLWDPKQYLERLQRGFAESSRGPASAYVVVEKILTGREGLPLDWPVAGTTGYDFLNLVNGLFVNQSNRETLDQCYVELIGTARPFEPMVFAAKSKILQNSMRCDLRGLSRLAQRIASKTRYGLDFTGSELQCALGAIVAKFPVYRTYMTRESQRPSSDESAQIEQAVEAATAENPNIAPEVFAFLKGLLLLCAPSDLDETGGRMSREWVLKFQQLTGPVMAKGLEDTVFYTYNRLISLNEVGGAPDSFGTDLGTFHQENIRRAERWPHTLLATATHDTKRGEDLRARINVLSEIPEEWGRAVLKWGRLNSERKTLVGGQPAPDTNDEYLFYQTLVGAWRAESEKETGPGKFRERMSNYMLKAIREAKTHTSWTDPNRAYEEATRHFVETVLDQAQANPFLDDFMLFHRNIAFFGLFNSLAQVVLKMTCPGVPDFYQGTELWDYNLVDPDNRRPVDYETRRELLAELRGKFSGEQTEMNGFLKSLLKNYQTGQIKLYLIWRILEFRRAHRQVFDRGDYRPMLAAGSKQHHVCAFARNSSNESVITVAARLVLGLTKGAHHGVFEPDVWQDTALPVPNGEQGCRYKNVLTEQVIALPADGSGLPIREVLALLPVAVLERIG